MKRTLFQMVGLCLCLCLSLTFITHIFTQSQLLLTQGKNHGEIAPAEINFLQVDLPAGATLNLVIQLDHFENIIQIADPHGFSVGKKTGRGLFGEYLYQVKAEQTGTYRLSIQPVHAPGRAIEYTIDCRVNTNKQEDFRQKIDQLFSYWDTDTLPGVAVAVVRDNQVVYQNTFGSANIENSIPLTTDAVFDAASLAKQFTGYAIAHLVQKGQIDLDTAVTTYLPELANVPREITVRQLCHHTSGIRDFPALFHLIGRGKVIMLPDILKLAAQQQTLNFDPGTDYTYSNTGYNLLAEIVHRVTDQQISEWAKENIFDQLEMKQTTIQVDINQLVLNRTEGYFLSDGKLKRGINTLVAPGSSSLLTTLEDLIKWAQYWDQNPNHEVIDLMTEPGALTNGQSINYGLGLGMGEYRGKPRISHTGRTPAGYSSCFVRFPEEQTTIIILSNYMDFDVLTYASTIADELFFDESEANKEKINEVAFNLLTAAQLNKFEGVYYFPPDNNQVEIRSDGAALYVHPPGEGPILLSPISDTSFYAAAIGITLHFPTGNRVDRAIALRSGQRVEMPRIGNLEPIEVKTVDLTDFVGHYFSEELQTTYELVLEQNQLIAKHPINPDILLTFAEANIFLGSEWYFGEVAFCKGAQGEVTGLKVTSGERSKHVFFQKLP